MTWRRAVSLALRLLAALLLVPIAWPATAAGEWLVAWARRIERPPSPWRPVP